MKKTAILLSTAIFITTQIPALAQFSHPGHSPANNIFAKVFGTRLNFSADMKTDIQMPGKQHEMILSGKIYFAKGSSRTEMDMTKMRGGGMHANVIKQMKAMGMGKTISIYRYDTKTIYMIYPGLHSYAKIATPEARQGTNESGTVEKKKLGKATVDGHPCVKNQYTVTGTESGHNTVLIAWQATDLKDYPIKIQLNPAGETKDASAPTTTLTFTSLDTHQPKASLFDPPTGYRVYTNVRAMVQSELMRKMSHSTGMPPNHIGMPPGHPSVAPKHP